MKEVHDPTAPEEIKKKDAEADALMQEEERFTGQVAWKTYANYLRFAGGLVWAPILLGLLTIDQCTAGKLSTALINRRRDLRAQWRTTSSSASGLRAPCMGSIRASIWPSMPVWVSHRRRSPSS